MLTILPLFLKSAGFLLLQSPRAIVYSQKVMADVKCVLIFTFYMLGDIWANSYRRKDGAERHESLQHFPIQLDRSRLSAVAIVQQLICYILNCLHSSSFLINFAHLPTYLRHFEITLDHLCKLSLTQSTISIYLTLAFQLQNQSPKLYV